MQVRISENLQKVLETAATAAKKYSNPAVGTEHVLYGLVKTDSAVGKKLANMGVKAEPIEKVFEEEEHVVIMGEPELTPRVKATLMQAFKLAVTSGGQMASCEHMLVCMLSDSSSLAYNILDNVFGADIRALTQEIVNLINGEDGAAPSGENGSLPGQLAELGVDLTRRAREHKIDPVIGRREEIERIIQILCRKTKNNPVLIGEPGVGKSAVVEGLAKEIVAGNVPELLKNKIVFSLDMGSIMAGTKYRGSMEEKLKDAINLIKSQGNIIVFIDELHTLAQAGGKEGEVSPSDILKPYLARGELQTIGATTTDEYRKFIETDKALERRFQPIMVAPPSVEDTVEILRGLKENYEAFHKVQLTDEAIVAAAKLSDRYIMDRFLPDKAIDLIDEAMSRAKVSGNTVPDSVRGLEEKLSEADKKKQQAINQEDYTAAARYRDEHAKISKQLEQVKLDWSKTNEKANKITPEDIAEIVAKWTKIPVSKLNETEKERLVHLEELLHERVIGQDDAVKSVAKAIRRARAGLKDPKRPIGTFLFLGPTGVGKTELTKALSAVMFDDENNVVRLDMSEYMEPHSVSKLLGAPPGYVGFDDGGQLTEQIRRKPYCVVLFDEIEKAHPDVYNVLLQLLDDGRLTDSQGRTVSFKNTIIIMTSNVGIGELKGTRSLGFAAEDEKEREKSRTQEILTGALRRQFKPEFLNRIDVITVFDRLSRDDIAKIADIMLERVQKTLSEKNITLRLSEAMRGHVIEKGYDEEYGARPLRRVIEQDIEDSVAEEYLAGRVKDGDIVEADFTDGRPQIRAVPN